MAFSVLNIVNNSLRGAFNALKGGELADSIGALGDAFSAIFQFLGVGFFAFGALSVARQKHLKWYEKLIPISMFAISALVSTAAAVAIIASLSLALPILLCISSTMTCVRHIAFFITEQIEKRRLKNIFKKEDELASKIDRLGIPKPLLKEYDKMLEAQALLRKYDRLPQRLFEFDPDTVREMCELTGVGQTVTDKYVEASKIQKDIKRYQMPEKLRQRLKETMAYEKWKKPLEKDEMRNLMVRVLNHSINVNFEEQEKLCNLFSMIPSASDQDIEETLDILMLPANERNDFMRFKEDAKLQHELKQLLNANALNVNWLKQPHDNIDTKLAQLDLSKEDVVKLKKAHEHYQLLSKFQLPPDLKHDLKIYLGKLKHKQSPQEQEEAGAFIVRLAEHFLNNPEADKSALLYTLVFEAPDFKFNNMKDWMKKAAKYQEQANKDKFSNDYGEILELFEKKQRLYTLHKATWDRLEIIFWTGSAALLSAIGTGVSIGLAATGYGAAAAVPIYAAFSAAAVIPSAISAIKGGQLALRNFWQESKVADIKSKVESAASPTIDEAMQRKAKSTQKARKLDDPRSFIKKARDNLASLWQTFKGLFSKKTAPSDAQAEQKPLLQDAEESDFETHVPARELPHAPNLKEQTLLKKQRKQPHIQEHQSAHKKEIDQRKKIAKSLATDALAQVHKRLHKADSAADDTFTPKSDNASDAKPSSTDLEKHTKQRRTKS